MRRRDFALLLLGALGACTPKQKAGPMAKEPEQNQPAWQLVYHDGSGNGFHFVQKGKETRFRYNPVTPAMSSSGHYSGGEKNAGTLSSTQADALLKMARSLSTNSSSHSDKRMMGTGSFELTERGKTERFIIKSSQLEAFDALVEVLRKR